MIALDHIQGKSTLFFFFSIFQQIKLQSDRYRQPLFNLMNTKDIHHVNSGKRDLPTSEKLTLVNMLGSVEAND